MLNDLYSGKTPLTDDLYRKTTDRFLKGVFEGYGKSFVGIKYDSPDFDMLNKLSYNAGTFAAFKNHNQIQDTVSLLRDAKGALRPKKEFLTEAKALNEKYNKRWLATEYDQAVSASSSAKRWSDIERTKDLYPNLTYIAVNDERTRERHRLWDGITLPIDHPFWNSHTPPNDWGCRCRVKRTQSEVNDQGFEVDKPVANKAGFNINFGKQGKVFDNSHPYYQVKAFKKVAKQAENALLAYQAEKILSLKYSGKITNSGLAVEVNKQGVEKFLEAKVKNTYEKNNLAYDLKNVLSQSTYNGSAEGKGSVKMRHYFKVKDKELWLEVLEEKSGKFSLGGAVDAMPKS